MLKFKYQASRLFNMLTVIILSLLCVLLNYLTQINFHRLELPKNKPEFSASGIEVSLFKPTGALLYRVHAESAIQFPNSNRISMRTLLLQAYSESSGELLEQLTSNDGWLDTSSSVGFLGQMVQLTVSSSDPTQVINVYTRDVSLNGKTRYASSSAPVKALQGKSILTGIGFSVDYEKKILIIESQVKVIYEK